MAKNDRLVTALNMAEHDEFYAELLRAHEAMNDEESQAFNARLILILANHIGKTEVLKQALSAAR
ncbi:MAG: DUF2783 domain-containing protein [Pseudomonadota bacterium]